MHKSLLSERRGLAIFSEKALMIAAALISLLLQIISFVTTWQGAEAYFSSAFPLAPLLFAVAVQSVVYFTSNSIRRKPGAGKIIALALLSRYGFTSDADAAERSAELTAEMSLIEGVFGASGSGFYSAAEQIRAEMLAGGRNTAERVFSLYEKLSGNRLEYTADIPGVTLGLPEYSELSAGKAPAAVREQMLGKISSACDTINAAGGDVSADSFPVENVYTLPLRAVFVDFRTDAAVSMALALLTDYLSLAAAVSYVQKKSILAARNTAQAAASDEFFFEQNIAGALRLGAFAEGTELRESDEKQLSERLAEYVSRFTAADFAAEQGCTLLARREDVKDHELLTAFLCQCGYAKLLTAEEVGTLGGKADSDCVLLRTKFLMWVSEKTAGKAV